MASFQPFEPNVKTQTAGFTVALSPGTGGASNSTTIASSTVGFAPCLLVTVIGSTSPVYIRMSGEVSPTATASDTPMIVNTTRLFANPSPGGTTGVAVFHATSSLQTVYFTPGQGGDV